MSSTGRWILVEDLRTDRHMRSHYMCFSLASQPSHQAKRTMIPKLNNLEEGKGFLQ